MAHVVIELRSGGYIIDSGFTVCEPIEEPEEGFAYGEETTRLVKNPVRILESLWRSEAVVAKAREVWCNDWVLDCNTGSIVLGNDWSSRSPMRRLAIEKVGR